MKKRPTGDSDGDDAICCLSFSLSPLPSHYIGECLVASRCIAFALWWRILNAELPAPPSSFASSSDRVCICCCVCVNDGS